MKNQKIQEKTEDILFKVSDVTESLSTRTKKVNFNTEFLSKDEVSDLKLFLRYTKSFTDLAKVHLLYHKANLLSPQKKDGKNM